MPKTDELTPTHKQREEAQITASKVADARAWGETLAATRNFDRDKADVRQGTKDARGMLNQ